MTKHLVRLVVCVAIVHALLPEHALAQTPLLCGQVAVGAISTAGERDQFTFFGEEGDVVTFTIADAGDIDEGFLASGQPRTPSGSAFGSFAQTSRKSRDCLRPERTPSRRSISSAIDAATMRCAWDGSCR